MKGLINRLVRRLSRSERATHAAVVLRNQCQMLIGYHFARSPDGRENGEEWLLETLAGRIDTFLDVGANVGDWSELMLTHNPNARGIAIEPGGAMEQLRGRFDGRLETVEAAVGDVAGEAELVEQGEGGRASSLVLDSATPSRSVPVITVDGLLESHGLDAVDFLKIDAEGYDGRVLAGATQALHEQRIGIVQFEYNLPWALAGSTLGHALDHLTHAGYETFALRSNSLDPVSYDRYGEFFSYSNFVAVSKRCAGWLQ